MDGIATGVAVITQRRIFKTVYFRLHLCNVNCHGGGGIPHPRSDWQFLKQTRIISFSMLRFYRQYTILYTLKWNLVR